ncbi:MAG: SpoIIE family protein phosphatase [Acidobacteriota bacterium]|nr:SpoIIE family protein phosphatase [Acidobacteriota bacterium]
MVTWQDKLRQLRMPTGLAGGVLWLSLWSALLWGLKRVPGPLGGFSSVLLVFAVVALAGMLCGLAIQLVRRHMLWSLRNKLVVTYLLIGAAPVVLVVTLVLISAYIAAGQFAIHLVDSRLHAELAQMDAENLHRTGLGIALIENRLPPRIVDSRDNAANTAGADEQRLKLPHRMQAFVNGVPADMRDFNPPGGKTPFGLPPWAMRLPQGDFDGLVFDHGDLFLVTIQQRRLNDGRTFTLMTSLQVDTQLMNLVADGLGSAGVLPVTASTASGKQQSQLQSGSVAEKPKPMTAAEARRSFVRGGVEPRAVNLADLRVSFVSTTTITNWDTGQPDNVLIEVNSRPSLLYRQLFGASLGGVITDTIRTGLVVLCIVFALIEAVALWMAIRVSRSITASVADLYAATQQIDHGDFTYRIGVTRNDQLAELSRSFNRMTGSLQRLMLEQKEKERLQSELAIAQEVQANLFPRLAHNLPRLDLHGVCRPARTVSGDYYDFLVFHEEAHDGRPSRSETGVGIALGDISGKGISAALLMATLHSAVRAYRFASEELVYSESMLAGLGNGRTTYGPECDTLFESPGRILALLNRHLYRSTQPEKYATLFLGHYDAASAVLTYSNAGQLPPLLLSLDGTVRRLECGGTVVGLMDGMMYDEGHVELRPGDILIAYSDGVTEPENDFGEFGEERLLEVVRRFQDQPLEVISAQVMLALDHWIGAAEQPDDITLVLARQL